jgi:hypothetical protein
VRAEEVRISYNPKKVKDPAERKKIKGLVQEINTRRATVERSPEWLKEAYSGLNIRKINDIPPEEFAFYKKYIDDGSVYIVVHPAFYVFFETELTLSSEKDKMAFPEDNIVERFVGRSSLFDYKMKILQEQEILLRNFVELLSMDEKLVVLILPGDYRHHMTYGHIEGLDEYARYINDITNMSGSVVYMESKSYSTGYLTEEDLALLERFIGAVAPEDIYVGGGYIGRCLENFYVSLTTFYDSAFLAPEISAVSPNDMDNPWVDGLLTPDGRINLKRAAYNLKRVNAYEKQQISPSVKGLRNFIFYPKIKS